MRDVQFENILTSIEVTVCGKLVHQSFQEGPTLFSLNHPEIESVPDVEFNGQNITLNLSFILTNKSGIFISTRRLNQVLLVSPCLIRDSKKSVRIVSGEGNLSPQEERFLGVTKFQIQKNGEEKDPPLHQCTLIKFHSFVIFLVGVQKEGVSIGVVESSPMMFDLLSHTLVWELVP